MIIERPKDYKRINESKKWVLVYGRRKTGKTFLVENFIKYDEYFFIKTDRGIITKENQNLLYESFIEILKRGLSDGKTIVVDEFHRLNQDFFDFLHFTEKKGKLILISSTLFLSKKLLSEKSALLGLFAEVPLGIINIRDTLNALKQFNLPKKELLEMAILLREPLAVDYFNNKKKAREIAADILMGSMKTVPALVGEIFLEEERELSATYESILRAIASGKINSGEISTFLFSRKVLAKDDPSLVQTYLSNLISFGIIYRIKVFNKNRFVYKLASPLLKIYYYSDEKYNLSERTNADYNELAPILDELMPRIVEDNARTFLAEENNLTESLFESSDLEVDACLLKFKNVEIAVEIKWGNLSSLDVNKAENNLAKIEAPRKMLFVQDKNKIKSKLSVIDVSDF